MRNKFMISFCIAIVLVGCSSKAKEQNNVTELQQAPQIEVAAEGKKAPDFTLNDPKGNPISLSSLRGKYVVLDFWGSWCRWCIKGIPDMKAYYKKYQGKFEILSIDFGDTKERWLNAIEENGINWMNVITDEKSAKELQTLYAIQGFPTKVIIDPKGKIVKIVVGEDPIFYTFLDELFQNP